MSDNKEILISRGERLIEIRNIVKLTRRKFAQKTGIAYSTVQNWEMGLNGGMSEKGANKLVAKLSEHFDVITTIYWLLYGKGEPPYFPNLLINQSKELDNTLLTEEDIIKQESLLFRKLNTNTVDLIVADGLMEPIFFKGDHISGKKYLNANEFKFSFCIVEPSQGEIIVRMIRKNIASPELFDLTAYNNGKLILTHEKVKIPYFAPVTWLRRTSNI